jgi:hypothetical protein
MNHSEFIQAGNTITDNEVEGPPIEYVGFIQSDWEKIDKEIRNNERFKDLLKTFLCKLLIQDEEQRKNIETFTTLQN